MSLSRRVGVFYGRLAFEALHVDHVRYIEGRGYAFLEIGNKGYRIVGCYGSGVIGIVADPRAVFCPVVKFVPGAGVALMVKGVLMGMTPPLLTLPCPSEETVTIALFSYRKWALIVTGFSSVRTTFVSVSDRGIVVGSDPSVMDSHWWKTYPGFGNAWMEKGDCLQ